MIIAYFLFAVLFFGLGLYVQVASKSEGGRTLYLVRGIMFGLAWPSVILVLFGITLFWLGSQIGYRCVWWDRKR